MATKDSKKNESWLENGKNLIIIALVVVAAVQGFLLFSKDKGKLLPVVTKEKKEADKKVQPPLYPPVSVAEVTLESEYRRFVLVIFDHPVFAGDLFKPLKNSDLPAYISPRVKGTWSWISPAVLKFEAFDSLKSPGEYTISLRPEKILEPGRNLSGETQFTLKTGEFSIKKMSMDERPADGHAGMAVVTGDIEFSHSVDPVELLRKAQLVDTMGGRNQTVEISLSSRYPSRWISFRSKPVMKSTEPRKVWFILPEGLESKRSGSSLGQAFRRDYTLYADSRLSVEGADGRSSMDKSSISVLFSSPVKPKEAGKYIGLKPEVEYSLSASGRSLILSGKFEPGEEYEITLSKGVKSADGAVLEKDFFQKVVIPHLEPKVSFKSPGMFLSRSGFKTIEMESVNTDKAELTIDRVYANNIFMLFNNYYFSSIFDNKYRYNDGVGHYLGDNILEKKLELDSENDRKLTTPLGLGKLIPEDKPGFYRVFLNIPGQQWEGAQRWVLITDLGIAAKRGGDDFLFLVSSFKDLGAKSGVRMRVISDQNQVLAQGETDGQGIWRTGELKLEKDVRPYMVLAEKDGDFSFLLFDQFKIDTTGLDVGGGDLSQKSYSVFAYGERDIYRPGEKVQGAAVLRDGLLDTPPAMPLIMRWKDPRGKELGQSRLQSDDNGLAEFSLDLPDYALTGGHTLVFEVGEEPVGEYRFQVEEFMPDRIKVEIDRPESEIKAGDKLRFTVRSNYFFGPPSAGMNVETRVVLAQSPFAPKGYEMFQFGDPDRTFEDREIFVDETGQAFLDDNGTKGYDISVPADLTPPAALEAVVSSRVRERGGRGVTAISRIKTHAYPVYPGLKRLADSSFKPGEEAEFTFIAVGPDGKVKSGAKLRAELFKDRWQTVLRRKPSGAYGYESIRDSYLMASQDAVSGDKEGIFSFTPEKYGSYRVVLSDPETGAAAQVSFYASGWGESPWAIENPARIELAPDREEYVSGQEAEIQVRAPFSGKLLVTVEREGVFDLQLHELDGNTAAIKIPLKEEYAPNVYVSAMLLRKADDLEPGTVARAAGSIPIFVNRSVNRAKVAVSAPAEIRPETELTINIQAEPDSTVTLAAVDEGILQLINQKTPDPFEYFYAKRKLGVEWFDIFSMLLPEVKPEIAAAPAGGGAGGKEGQFVRTESLRRVKPVAFWSGPIKTDSNGTATYSVQVPEFQGALRLMAVSVKDRRFGAGQEFTRVKSPLTLTPTFPRFASLGETLLVPVALRNDTGQDGVFDLNLRSEGPEPELVEIEEPARSIEIPAGAERLLYFSLKTGDKEGGLKFVCTASGRNETAKAEVELGLRSSLPQRTVVKAGAVGEKTLGPGLSAPFPTDQGFVAGTATREIRVGRLPLISFHSGLKSLLRYPYGCIEQTTSKAFPLLYLADLIQELEPELFEKSSPQSLLLAGINRIRMMQLGNGGFAMWPGGDRVHPWGTVYATHFLVEADKVPGDLVPKTVINQALKHLGQSVRNMDNYSKIDVERAAYALFVLARAGKADRGGMDHLRTNYGTWLSPQAQTLLGAAYYLDGTQDGLRELGAKNPEKDETVRQSGDNFDSTLRNQALQLSVLIDTDPGDPRIAPLAQSVSRHLGAARSLTTQESGFAFMALGKFFNRQKSRPSYSGRVYAGSELLSEFKAEKTLVLSGIKGREEIRFEMDSGYEPGSAYFSINTRGTPEKSAYQPISQGMRVERAYLSRKGEEVDLAGLAQGDLIVLETSITSLDQPVKNVVVSNLLPTCFEIENPRLSSTEKLSWIDKDMAEKPAYQDLRDDRVLFFLDLKKDKEVTLYSLIRVVAPGEFNLPPIQVEAMYAPELMASGPAGEVKVMPAAVR